MTTLDAAANLQTTMWKTRGSRFAARQRLRRANYLSAISIVSLSIYVIVGSIILLVFSDNLSDGTEKWLNILNIGLSIFIISFSLLESSRDYLGGAEAMNQSALRIGRVYGKLKAMVDSGDVSEDMLSKCSAEYTEILDEITLNHEEIDFILFRASHHNDFGDWWSKFWPIRVASKLILVVYLTWFYLVAIFMVPILAFIFAPKFFSGI